MRLVLIIFFLLNLFYSAAQVEMIKLEETYTNPGNLEAYVFVPKQESAIKRPLLIALHGCNQNAEEMAKSTGWNKLALLHNFIVLYPQQRLINNGNLCFNWFLKKDNTAGGGEIESIHQMIQKACMDYSIDTNRIFVTGLSAGAAMSIALLANYPNVFKAGASLAGCAFGIVEQNPRNTLKAMRGKLNISQEKLIGYIVNLHETDSIAFPKLIIVQGDKDFIVNKKNAQLLIDQWTGIHSIENKPDTTITNFAGNTKIKRIEYWSETNHTVIIYYQIADLGHAVPIDPGESNHQGGNKGIFAVDIDFHSTYQIALDFELLK